MKNFGKNKIGKKLLIFAIASFMWSSTITMISVTPLVSVTSGAPPPDPVVDGVISPGEYSSGMHIVLEGPWDSPSSPYDGPLDGYLYWDTQYLWIAVNEPVPEWGGGGSFIEFMWDAGIHGTMPYYHAWVLFSDGNWQYVRCGKPSGSWGWAADPFPGHSWWATNTATEFKFDYTDYGTVYGDTIKLIVDSADRSASSLTFGNCQIWPYVSPSNPDYYPSETPASVATWGDVHLNGAPPPPVHVVDGVIGPSEYAGGMAVELVGKTDPTWKVDAYIDWDSTFLYVAVDEVVPNYPTGGGLDWIEFTIDPGATWPYVHAFAMFGSGSTHSTRSTKPSGSWGVVPHPFVAASSVATEFSVDYTAFGIALGDTIKMSIDRNDASAPTPPPHYTYGFAAFWPAGANVYDGPPGTAPDPTTWADVTLSGGGPPPPPPDHIVDGIIIPDEYEGGMAVELVEASWTVDAYIDWDAQYLYVAVDEPCPTYIEFAFDAGSARDRWDLFVLFGSGSSAYQRCMKPGGAWTTVTSPSAFLALSNTATEFKVDYTDFGIALGDTIKMCIERGSTPNAFWPEGGIIWQNPPRTPDPSTWGDVTLTAPPVDVPPVADANGPYEDADCDDDYTINLDGSGSTDPDGTIVTYDWDFGDGTGYHNDIGATPSYTYPTFGEYTVTLRVTDDDGLSDTDTSTAKVYGVIADAGGPYEDSDCDDVYTVDFDGSGSTGYQTPLIYDWDFGDGTGYHNDIGATPSNTYPTFGEYTVTLRVTESGNGCSDTDTATVKIYNVTANANGPYSSVDGSSVQFDSSGSSSCCGETLSYTWDFDDGVISPMENPLHTYTSIGVYTVTLTVEGSISHCTDVDTATVTVTSTVVSDANGPYEGTVGIPVDFTGSASGGAPPYQYYWSFGDGTYSPEQNPSYTYDAPGTYAASLKVTDDIDGSDTDYTDVVIHPAEAVVADADGPYSANVDEVIQFHGSATGGTQPYSWYWEFGDGDTSTLQNPTHPYDTLGEYTATLTVTDAYGMTDDDTAQVSIGGYPPNKPTIDGSNSGKPGEEYEYTFNAVDPDGDNVKYHINWGDTNSETTAFSSSGTDVKVKHTWSTGGTYTIKATAEDSNGLVGPEGTLSVSMPRNRATQTLFLQFLENLMQRFPLLAKLLQQYPILYQLLQRVLRL